MFWTPGNISKNLHFIQDKYLDGTEQAIVKQNLGMILGLPLTGEDFKAGVEKLRGLGIFRIALAGFESPLEERVRQRCCFISRDELVQLYRELQTKSKTANPFIWGGNQKVSQAQKAALKIFEELGFIQCLGGSDEFFLKWIPAKNKLELDSSSRYRLTKERFDEALKFHKELLNTVLKVL